MTERITRLPQANIGGGGGRVTAKGHVGIWEAMEMFDIFIVIAVTWVYTFSKFSLNRTFRMGIYIFV